MEEIIEYEQLPVIPLRGMVAFPGATMHFDVGREKSMRALEKAVGADQRLLLAPQRSLLADDPGADELFQTGTVARVKQVLRLPGETARVLVECLCRAQIETVLKTDPFLRVRVRHVQEQPGPARSAKAEAAARIAYQQFEEYMELSERQLGEEMLRLLATREPGVIADIVAQASTIRFTDKAALLAERNGLKRLLTCNRLMQHELEVLRIEEELQDKANESVSRGQRDYYLREQLKVIQEELGEDDEEEFDAYEQQLLALHLPEESEQKLLKELKRLRKQPYGSSEAAVIRSWLDFVLELPWNTVTRERVNLAQAQKLLDADHYGLEKVKQRVLEFLAVRKLAPDVQGQILCLVGPPGVGKTSVAMSVARCLNRRLARISLGGVHDEAEIRGHRKTYVGAMPGRILSGVNQAGARNALLLLDEIDKLGSDYRGDPSAALLEVLDAEQNACYRDNYLEIPFDLSGCMFITTANTTDTIPRPLLDRMEVIELGSYTDEEKRMIAKRHLLPKQLARHGVKKSQLALTDNAIREIISCYTRESGVRRLEQELAAVCRKAALRLAGDGAVKKLTVTPDRLEDYLGVRRYLPERLPESDPVGLVNGLAWTSVGGEVLQVECNVVDGSGKLELTGNLGDVMKESVHAALSYIRSRAAGFGIPEDFYKTKDIHVHFPEGAVPKDGPSAGITVCTAIVSALTGATVRRDLAMTGEISIRGRVLPIGGLKEKTMAAYRMGIRTVVIPEENAKDLEEIDPVVRKALHFITVSTADTVVETALQFPRRETAAAGVVAEAATLPPAAKPVARKQRKTDIRQ